MWYMHTVGTARAACQARRRLDPASTSETTGDFRNVSESTDRDLPRRVRDHLRHAAAREAPLTYQALTRALELQPPNTIHRVALALERTMEEDARQGRPFIAALVISRAREGLPAPGFFDCAQRLGRFQGAPSGPEARRFHESELRAAMAFWADDGNR